jgi:hypothetical protein
LGKRLLICAVFLLGLITLPDSGLALSIDSSQDCDANAVINCGLLDSANAGTAYQQNGVADIYSNFGITSQDINNLSGTAVAGVVTNNNNVWIHRGSGLCPDVDTSTLSSRNQQVMRDNPNLCLVATNAMTAGRQNMPGSTRVSSGGTVFYSRPPSVSFQSSSLPAFVVMNGGRFSYAIIASCGNPVMATPVTPVKKTRAATPAAVQPTVTQPPQSQTQTQTQSQSQSQTVNVTQPVAAAPAVVSAPAPVAPTTAPAATTVLPNTGPGNIIGLGGLSTVLGTIGHFVYSRRRLPI